MIFIHRNEEMPDAERSHDRNKPVLAYIISGKDKSFRVVHYVIYYLNKDFEVRYYDDGDIVSKTYRWEDWYSSEAVSGIVGWAYIDQEFFNKVEDDIKRLKITQKRE